MPEFTTGGIRIPLGTDQPRRNATEQLARSIDDPQGVTYRGKIRNLQTSSSQSFASTTTLSTVNNWIPAGGARGDTDQGNGCGITLGGTNSEQLTVSEAGFYFMYANYPWASTAGGGIRRVALRDPDSGAYYQSNSDSGEAGTNFLGANVSCLVWLAEGQSIIVEAAQNSGGNLNGGNVSTRTAFIVAKFRLM